VSMSNATLVAVYTEDVPCKWCKSTLVTSNLRVDANPQTA